MKKLITLVLAVAFVCASAIGCGGDTKSGTTTKTPTGSTESKKTP